MITAGGNGPLESHSRANLVHRRVGLIRDSPLSKQMCLGVGLIRCMPLKMLLCSNDDAPPQHRSILRGICPINPHKKHIRTLSEKGGTFCLLIQRVLRYYQLYVFSLCVYVCIIDTQISRSMCAYLFIGEFSI